MTDPRYAARDVTESAPAPRRGPDDPTDTGPGDPTDTGPDGPTAADVGGPTDHLVTTDPSAADHTADGTSATDTASTATASTATASTATADDGNEPVVGTNAAPTSDPDRQATTQLPTTGWGSPSGSPSEYQSGSGFGAQSGTQTGSPSWAPSGGQVGGQSASQSGAGGPSWSSDETRGFPAYRPQSYPTYPPALSQTTELPAVDAGGPPPTTAAAYGGPGAGMIAAGPAPTGPAAAGMVASQPERPRRRAGAGFAGALGLIGLAAAAYGAFALPVQNLGPLSSPYFASLRELSTHKLTSSQANAHSVSLVGGHAATLWWRYGLAGTLGVLALLLLVQICVPVLRRAAGVLLFLAGLATIAGYAFAVHQTNDYRSVALFAQGAHRLAVRQLGLGIWVAVAGCAVAALGGLIAAVQSTRR